MYKRILVPFDGSLLSREVLPYAIGLAAVHDTDVVLLRVLDGNSDQDEAIDSTNKLARAYGVRAECLPPTNGVAHRILEEALREPQTLVAMTSRGHSGLAEVALGSVAQDVLRGVIGPVFIYHPIGTQIPERASARLQRVVLPLGGGEAHAGIADDAARFAHWIDAELEVVSVIQPLTPADFGQVPESDFAVIESSFVRFTAEKLAKAHGVRINWDTLHGTPVDAIVEHVQGKPNAMLAMAKRRSSALQATFLGSVTAGCLRRAGVPILMRRAP